MRRVETHTLSPTSRRWTAARIGTADGHFASFGLYLGPSQIPHFKHLVDLGCPDCRHLRQPFPPTPRLSYSTVCHRYRLLGPLGCSSSGTMAPERCTSCATTMTCRYCTFAKLQTTGVSFGVPPSRRCRAAESSDPLEMGGFRDNCSAEMLYNYGSAIL